MHKQWHKEQINPFEDILARWLLLLGMVDARKQKVYDEIYQELEALAMKDDDLLNAFSVWEELSMSKEEAIAYQSRLKHILDEEAKYAHARYEGREQSIEQGKVEGKKEHAVETAKTLLADKMPDELIVKYSGLTMEELAELKKSVQE